MHLGKLHSYFKTTSFFNPKITNFNQTTNKSKDTPLIFALKFNKKLSLNLNKEQFSHLIKNTDLKITSSFNETPLLLALQSYEAENLPLDIEDFDILIQSCDISKKSTFGLSPILFVSKNLKNVPLTKNQIEQILSKNYVFN